MEIGIPGTRREFLVMCSLLALGHRSFAVENTATILTVDERLRGWRRKLP